MRCHDQMQNESFKSIKRGSKEFDIVNIYIVSACVPDFVFISFLQNYDIKYAMLLGNSFCKGFTLVIQVIRSVAIETE